LPSENGVADKHRVGAGKKHSACISSLNTTAPLTIMAFAIAKPIPLIHICEIHCLSLMVVSASTAHGTGNRQQTASPLTFLDHLLCNARVGDG
jgi:hypothetical protein